jgi:hypothetical protein
MKKNLTLVLFASLAVGLQAAVVSAPMVHPPSAVGQTISINLIDNGANARVDRDEFYDFEGDTQGWASHGTGLTNDTWHVEPVGFGAVYTDTWWSADAGVGGYLSSSFVYLETASFSLAGATSPTLNFDLFYACEAPGGEPVGYNGWDGCNVWASTDGGATWAVINGSPAYTASSSFAFGVEFGMGPGIPQWGGTAAGWQAASFDLSSFNGQADVKLRFVMCADPAFDYLDDPTMIGMQVDNIVVADGVTLWADDGVSNTGGAPSTGYYVYGDEWAHTGEEWRCTNGLNLGCWIDSPWISFTPPALINLVQDIRCDLPDSDGNDDGFLEDYFHIEYTTDGTTWNTLTYDYNGDSRPDWTDGYYTYSNADVFNGSLNFTLPTATQFKIRYRITTDGDHDGGQGTGLWVDNVDVVVASVPEHDLAMSKAWIDYPRVVGEFQYPKIEIANLGASVETNQRGFWKVYQDDVLIHGPRPINTTAFAIDPLDSIRTEMTPAAPATWKWAPPAEGDYLLEIYTNLVTDLDRSNDTLSIPFSAFEDGFGILRYDYELSSAWTLSASPDAGALVRFDPIAEPWTSQFFAASVYNVEAGDEVHIVIHEAGADDSTIGPLLAEYTTTVSGPEEVYPNTFFRYLGTDPNLRCVDQPIWVGIRGNTTNPTGVVGLSGDNGGPYWEQHTYSYDYTDNSTAPWNGDLRMWMQVDWGVESELPFEVELTGTQIGNSYTLNWNSPGPVDGYLVYRSADGYDFSGAPVADLPKGTTSYNDTIVAGQRWFYRVVGYNGLCPVPAE